jgi:FkbM family methyltransferase
MCRQPERRAQPTMTTTASSSGLDLAFIRKLSQFLNQNPCLGLDTRTQILYPLLDKAIPFGKLLTLQLANGLQFEYAYTSSIAKEVLLRDLEHPSHAWEPMTSKSVELIMADRPGPALIGGAYFGDHALIAARELQLSGNLGPVICVEPNRLQGQLLIKNAMANSLREFVLWDESILWDQPGIPLTLNEDDSHAAVRQDDSSIFVSTTIDAILAKHSVESLSLLMLDIEGSEEKALRGATSVLDQAEDCAPVVIVEIHRSYVNWECGITSTDIVKLLMGYGYHVYALRDCQSNWELGLKAPEIIPLDTVYLEGPPHGFNLIASKKDILFDRLGFRRVPSVSPKYLRHREPSLHLPRS